MTSHVAATIVLKLRCFSACSHLIQEFFTCQLHLDQIKAIIEIMKTRKRILPNEYLQMNTRKRILANEYSQMNTRK